MRQSLIPGQREEQSQWIDRTGGGLSAQADVDPQPKPVRRWLVRLAVALTAFGAPALSVLGLLQLSDLEASGAERATASQPDEGSGASGDWRLQRMEEKQREYRQHQLLQRQCLEQRVRVLARPKQPGTPVFDANRRDILVRTKAEPVVFIRPPTYQGAVSKNNETLRKAFERSKYPSTFLGALSYGFTVLPEKGRTLLLRDGYLYADDPERAFALVHHVRAEQLYKDERIWIQRGEHTFFAERKPGGKYTYISGPQAGKEVSLMLFDRVGVGEPSAPLHRDFRALRYRLHFDRADVIGMTEDRLVADLHYGGLVVPTVLKSEGARLSLQCEAVPPRARKTLELYRDRGARKLRVVQALRKAMLEQIEEGLPFDEPYKEWGQQDGVLRYKWRDAYFGGKKRFKLNGFDYYVFNEGGRPKVPQVCVDFLTDTLERASGSWWRPLGQPPGRINGAIDFNTLAVENHDLRRVPGFIARAQREHEWFDIHDVPPNERIPFWRGEDFYKYLSDNFQRFTPGDIVVIRGLTPFEKKWEQRVMHYHSFFVYESDPVSGMPIAIVGNAGQPSLRIWDTEARRTPRRSIWHRLRPRLHWLEKIIADDMVLDVEPAPLSAG